MNTNISEVNNQSGIYRIMNIINGKFYIGSTRNFRKRFREHRYNLRKGIHVNKHLQSAFNKYGKDNFVFEVLEIVENKDMLLEKEQKYLDRLNPCDQDIGYNFNEKATSYSACGEKHHSYGITRTEEQKEKIRAALMGHEVTAETRLKISKAVKGKNTGKDHWSYGKPRSEQHRRNHSTSMKGKFAGDKNPSARKIVQLTMSGEFINKFNTMKEAEKTGALSGNIVNCCRGKRNSTGGYKWMYLEEYETMKALE